MAARAIPQRTPQPVSAGVIEAEPTRDPGRGRAARIEELKAAVAAGRYHVPTRWLAVKILERAQIR